MGKNWNRLLIMTERNVKMTLRQNIRNKKPQKLLFLRFFERRQPDLNW